MTIFEKNAHRLVVTKQAVDLMYDLHTIVQKIALTVSCWRLNY